MLHQLDREFVDWVFALPPDQVGKLPLQGQIYSASSPLIETGHWSNEFDPAVRSATVSVNRP